MKVHYRNKLIPFLVFHHLQMKNAFCVRILVKKTENGVVKKIMGNVPRILCFKIINGTQNVTIESEHIEEKFSKFKDSPEK